MRVISAIPAIARGRGLAVHLIKCGHLLLLWCKAILLLWNASLFGFLLLKLLHVWFKIVWLFCW